MNDGNFLIENSPYLFIVYIVIKELFPFLSKAIEVIMPGHIAKQKSVEQKANELKMRELELEEKKSDIAERQTVAIEQMQRILANIETRQSHIENSLQTVSSAVATANQALVVVLDRAMLRRREDYEA